MYSLQTNDDSDTLLTTLEQHCDDNTYLLSHAQRGVWDKVSELLSGSGRMRVMRALGDGPLDQRSIARLASMERSNARRTIKALCISGLIECLTPHQPRAKLYRTTSLGKEALKRANERWHTTERKQ